MNHAILERLYRLGAAYWPKLDLPLTEFRRHCLQVPDGNEWYERVQHPGDLFLCAACTAGDPEALRLLDDELKHYGARAVRRVQAEPEFVDETLQCLRNKLLVGSQPKLLRYAGRGPLAAWLGVSATRTGLDLLRAQKGAGRQVELSESLQDATRHGTKELLRSQYGEAFQRSLEKAIADLPSRDRNVLRLHLVGRCSIDQLGTIYRVDRSTTARWLRKARQRIFEAVRQDLKHGYSLSDSEFSSIAQGVQSQLNVDIESTLAEA